MKYINFWWISYFTSVQKLLSTKYNIKFWKAENMLEVIEYLLIYI